MNREERRLKRKKDVQNAAITIAVLLAAIVVAVIVCVFAFHRFVKPKIQKSDTKTVEATESSEAQDSMSDVGEEEVQDPLIEQAKEIAAGMTVEQKVAQMFFITPDALTGVAGATKAGDSTKEAYSQYPVGGIVYQASNLIGTDQTKEMLSNMKSYSQEIAGLPIFLGVEEEGGSVAPIASNGAYGVTNVGNMSEIGATGDIQNAYNAGNTIGGYLSALGFNLDFAPVADVLSNPENTIVAARSFGSDAELVADMVCAQMQGLNETQITSVVKYFPGYGAAAGDSTTIEKSLDELKANELVSFQQAIDNGVSMVMVGHIAAPAVTGDDTPSSLSSVMITDVLRNQMGFKGVVVTEAMNQSAITSRYNSGDAAVAAISAGADVILMPDDFNGAYQAVLDAVTDGTLTQERIDESVVRIIKVKLML